ncbi:MAG: hypothetical protein ACT4PI_06730 [Actinomycetota bacterium]
MTTRRVQLLLATVALTAALVTACGGGDGDGKEKTKKTSAPASTSTVPSTRAPLDLAAFVGRWFGAPVDLLITEDGSGMLVFPELAADGSDVVAMTFLISEVSAGTASADVQSNPATPCSRPVSGSR